MSKLTPEQIKAIAELKSRKAKEREEKAAAEKETSEFIAKEFGTGETPAPETPATAAPAPAPETPAPAPETPAPAPETPATAAPADTITLFREWLRTPEGLDASDPRLPNDAVRRGVFLEDALSKAFAAGYNSRTV